LNIAAETDNVKPAHSRLASMSVETYCDYVTWLVCPRTVQPFRYCKVVRVYFASKHSPPRCVRDLLFCQDISRSQSSTTDVCQYSVRWCGS